MALHLVKLCVGAEGVQDLIDWHAQNRGRWPEGRTIHVTRMWPKRAEELLRRAMGQATGVAAVGREGFTRPAERGAAGAANDER